MGSNAFVRAVDRGNASLYRNYLIDIEEKMGLFDIFKSKQQRTLDNALQNINDQIFPMGKDDVLRDCNRIAKILKGKFDGDELRGFVAGCKTLVFINGQMGGDPYDDDKFIASFIRRSKERISEMEARDVFVYLAGESMARANLVKMMASKGGQVPDALLGHIDSLQEIYAAGTLTDRIPSGHGEYGLTVTNPIPTVCVQSSNLYLSRLRYKGAPIEFNRSGSTGSPVTKGNVDIYSVSHSGAKIATVYICPYHRKDSKIPPSGFTFERV